MRTLLFGNFLNRLSHLVGVAKTFFILLIKYKAIELDGGANLL